MKRLHRDPVPLSTEPPTQKRRATASHHAERKDISKRRQSSIDESTRNEESQPEPEPKPLLMPFPHPNSLPNELDEWLGELVSMGCESSWKHENREQIKRVLSQKQAPRYLFRACLLTKKSKPDSSAFASLTDIVPLHFRAFKRHKRRFPMLFQLPHKDVSHYLQAQRLLGEKEGPLFSTWSSDLGRAAQAAKALSASTSSSSGAKVFLAVIDAQKLESHNAVIPSALCPELGLVWPQGEEVNEMLVYGPLGGKALQAVEFGKLSKKASSHRCPSAFGHILPLLEAPSRIAQRAAHALLIGSKFDPAFALPVAAMTVSLLLGNEKLYRHWNRGDPCQEWQDALNVFRDSPLLPLWVPSSLFGDVPFYYLVPKYTTPAAERGLAFLATLIEEENGKKFPIEVPGKSRGRSSRKTFSDDARLSDEKIKAETDRDVQITLEATPSERRKRTPSIRNIPSGKMDIDTKKPAAGGATQDTSISLSWMEQC